MACHLPPLLTQHPPLIGPHIQYPTRIHGFARTQIKHRLPQRLPPPLPVILNLLAKRVMLIERPGRPFESVSFTFNRNNITWLLFLTLTWHIIRCSCVYLNLISVLKVREETQPQISCRLREEMPRVANT